MSEKLRPPIHIQKTPLSLKIESKLLEEVKGVAKKRRLKLTQVVEYGMRKFLEATEEET